MALDNLIGNSWKYTSKHARARIEFGAAAATAASGGGASGWAFFLIRTCPRRAAAPSAAGSFFGAYLRINAATTSSSSVLMWFLSTAPCFARSARSSLLVFPNCLASSKTLMADPF